MVLPAVPRVLILAVALNLAPASLASDAAAARQPVKTAPAERAQSAPAQPLTAAEVRDLAARSEKAGPEVAGGALSNEHLTYALIALAAAVIVLIAK
ncbi:MAG: hypothetical protein ACRD44_08155 [Bryobacteraceae bacterium]